MTQTIGVQMTLRKAKATDTAYGVDGSRGADPEYLTFHWGTKMRGHNELPMDLSMDLMDLELYSLFDANNGWIVSREALAGNEMLDLVVRKHKEKFVYNPITFFFYLRAPEEYES